MRVDHPRHLAHRQPLDILATRTSRIGRHTHGYRGQAAAADLEQLALIVWRQRADERQAAKLIPGETRPQPIGSADLKRSIDASRHIPIIGCVMFVLKLSKPGA